MKYDNTILYEKNVEKDQKLFNSSEEIQALRIQFENEKARSMGLDRENRKVQKELQEARYAIEIEKERNR